MGTAQRGERPLGLEVGDQTPGRVYRWIWGNIILGQARGQPAPDPEARSWRTVPSGQHGRSERCRGGQRVTKCPFEAGTVSGHTGLTWRQCVVQVPHQHLGTKEGKLCFHAKVSLFHDAT